MLWSRFFIPTTKETPSDAVVPSHQLAVRAGLIRQVTAGSYAYLPLGWRVLRKIIKVIREEMEDTSLLGAIELHMPALQPVAWWQQTGRVEDWGEMLLRPAGSEWQRGVVFAPTHEEAFTDLALAHVNSYKQLSLLFYQIQTKFRGEARPGGGLLRLREFIMMDAYSFEADKARLDITYQKMYAAFSRIFTCCGLPFLVVEAEPGPMGGEASHEFVVFSPAGDEIVARSEDAQYAANLERAARQVPPLPPDPPADQMRPLEEVHTPGCPGIEDVARFLNVPADQMIKTLVYELVPEGGKDARAPGDASPPGGRASRPPQFLVACVRGDQDVNEHKLRRLVRERGLGGEPRLCPLETAAAAGLVIGYVGPHIVNRIACHLVVDPDARAARDAVTGANRAEYHVRGFNWSRELQPERLAAMVVVDIRNVVEGDLAPSPPAMPGARLRFTCGIEVGHMFKLGTRYSHPMGATFLDAAGRSQELVMGSYGIGLDRVMAAAIEAHHDTDGIAWPMSIAPFEVIIVAIDARDDEVITAAKRLHDDLELRDVDVLLDNRDERAGVKFKDADLIGIPLRITVGKKVLAGGAVELKARGSGQVERIELDRVVEEVARRVAVARSAAFDEELNI